MLPMRKLFRLPLAPGPHRLLCSKPPMNPPAVPNGDKIPTVPPSKPPPSPPVARKWRPDPATLVPGTGPVPPPLTWTLKERVRFAAYPIWLKFLIRWGLVAAAGFIWWKWEHFEERRRREKEREIAQLLAGEDFTELERVANELLASRPDWPRVLYLRGSARLLQDKFQTALEDLQAAIEGEGEPLNEAEVTSALVYASAAFLALDHTSEARECAEEALRRNDDDRMAWRARARSYSASGEIGKALSNYERALQCSHAANDWLLLTERAELMIELKHPKAVEAAKALRKREPLALHPRVLVAEAMQARGDLKGALSEVEDALLLHSDAPLLYRLKITLLRAMRRREAALEAAKHALYLSPGDSDLRALCKDIYTEAGETLM